MASSCGPPPAAGTASSPQAEQSGGSSALSFNLPLTVLKNEPADTISASPSAVWRALPAAYASVGLQVLASDSASQSLTSPVMRVHQFLGGQSLSRYLECGASAFGDVAATQEITMRVRSTVEPGPNGTSVVRTLVRALATPQGNDRFKCGSTRRLELRIISYIQQHMT